MPIPKDFRSSLLGFSDAEADRLESGDLLVHRVFPFDRFIDLLRSRKLALVKPKLWDDPYENPLNRELSERNSGRKLRVPHYNNGLFGQCWSLCFESDATWRIYSGDKRGVLVSANAAALFASAESQLGHPFEMLCLGKVQYRSQEELKNIFESDNFLREVLRAGMYTHVASKALLYKRDSFKHEEEVRFILSRHVSEVPGDLCFIGVNLEASIAAVTLDPRLSDADFERSAFLISAAGYKGQVKRSTLYAMPDFALTIPSLEWLFTTDDAGSAVDDSDPGALLSPV